MGKCVLANQACPQTSDVTARRYCPAWWETMAHDGQGNQRVLRGCAWAQLPMYLNEFAGKAASAAEAAQGARNEVAALGEPLHMVLTLHTPLASLPYVKAPQRLPSHDSRSSNLAESPAGDQEHVSADSGSGELS